MVWVVQVVSEAVKRAGSTISSPVLNVFAQVEKRSYVVR